jgi:hypothetical protein
MTLKSTALIAAAALYCFACNSNSDLQRESTNKKDLGYLSRNLDSSENFKIADTINEPQQVSNSDKTNQNGISVRPFDWGKKIVKNATLNAEVKNYKSFSQQLNEKVQKYGGYVSQEEQSQSEYQVQNSVVIKVPVDQFENAINDLTKDVTTLNEKHISSDDVTTQLVDGKSRLEAKKQVRQRYLDLLKQARNMAEILTVQKEINEIQEEIELVNGRINTLSHESAMSTINFTFFQVLNASAKAEVEKNPGFMDQAKIAFANGWFWLGQLFIAFVSIWPLLTIIILGIWFFRKKQMPKMKKNLNAS